MIPPNLSHTETTKIYIVDDCGSLPWERLYSSISVDDQVQIFSEYFKYPHGQYALLHFRRIRYDGCPWFTSEIRALIVEREFLHTRYLRLKTDESPTHVKIIRNKVNTNIRPAKKIFNGAKFSPKLSSKKLWANLRSSN